MDATLISIGLGLFVGLILALTGAGGSILAVPLLAFSLNLSITEAAPIVLLAVVLASAIAAIQGLRAGIVRYKAATLISSVGLIFAPLGVWLAQRTPNQFLSLIFAVVLVYVAWRMWRQSTHDVQVDVDKPEPACAVNPATSKLFWTAPCTKRLMATGSVAGFLSGLLGVGGGFVIVPTLHKVTNLDIKSIVATSLTVIALVSVMSLATYITQGTINWHIAIPFSIATIAGMFAGRLLANKISNQTMQRTFAGFALLVALALAAKVFI